MTESQNHAPEESGPLQADDPSPTVRRLLAGLRKRVLLRTALRALGVAIGLAGIVGAGLLVADAAIGLPATVRRIARWLPALMLAGAVPPLLRLRRRATDGRLSLLVDERAGLGNIVSTLRAPNTSGPVAVAFRERADLALRDVDPAGLVRLDAGGPWAWAAAGVVLAVLAMVGTSSDASLRDRWLTPTDAVSVGTTGTPDGPETAPAALPTLGALDIRVQPPAYTGLPGEQLGDGNTLSALPGTRVTISGDGTARATDLVIEVAGGRSISATSGEGWDAEWIVGPEDRGLSIAVVSAGQVVERRVLPLRLMRDRAPSVDMLAPSEDLVLASSSATLGVQARALDDHGVDQLTLHWVHSRGSGESFDFSEGVWTWDSVRSVEGGREGRYRLSLPALALAPGDVLHVRVTAQDGNDITGPGVGVSATRQIRISREDDLSDITTLVGFPIEREREPLLSQRMIILLTEELRDTASSLNREALLAEARSIADEQARLRGRIGEQIFSRATGAMQDPEEHLDFEEGEAEVFLDELENAAAQGPVIDPETGMANIANVEIPAHDHDSDPIVAINRSLLTVYNYMWDAERQLRSAMLDPSLVPQGLALDLLQEMRNAERIFPRGRVAVAPVDVPGVRGTGEIDDAAPIARNAGQATRSRVDDVVATLDAMLDESPVPTGRSASVEISGLALDLLESLDDPGPSQLLVDAAALAMQSATTALRERLSAARRELRGAAPRVSAMSVDAPPSLSAARYSAPSGAASSGANTVAPFVFATVRYGSGDWDSAPLVPANLIHSLAQYTSIPLEPVGVTVDLSSEDVLEYPFLYLTGHLPVFFSESEGRNLVDFVERGGFIFIDDHNHDIDGAFHRSVTAELGRLFGQQSLQPLPNDHELYSTFFRFEDGPPITGHELSGWGDGLIHRELQHVAVGGRIGVLYSNKDYSSEWSYHADNKRFLAVDNTRFGVNILVYALTR